MKRRQVGVDFLFFCLLEKPFEFNALYCCYLHDTTRWPYASNIGADLLFSTAYYVAFGPHGPRAPTSQPGDNLKIFLSTVALIAIGGAVFFAITAKSTWFLTPFRLVYVTQFLSYYRSHSSNYDQGMATSLKRTCEGDEPQSYFWSVLFFFSFYFFFQWLKPSFL